MGSIEENIAKQAVRSGLPIPDRILNAPELQLGLELFIKAFFDLDTTRSHNNGLVRISWFSIEEYAKANGFDEDLTERLHKHIRLLDNEHLQRLEKKLPKAPNNK